MAKTWTEKKLRALIESETEESLTLEYKSAEALGKSAYQKTEITKDVSAFANSAGGTLIYGIRESSEHDRKHLPVEITPVNRTQISREWLEQIINGIRPRIEGILIHSVSLSSGNDDVAYVVEIPPSNTAHQSTSHRYYKRFNFQSVPMEDYEIRDVMFRRQAPDVSLRFLINKSRNSISNQSLMIEARNLGATFAQYVACLLDIPVELNVEIKNRINLTDGGKFYRHRLYNLNQEFSDENFKANFPLLRNMSMTWRIPLTDAIIKDNYILRWKVFADNSTPKEGIARIKELEILDLEKN